MGTAMGKASRLKERSAREKIAAQREAARRAEMRRRVFVTGGSVLAVAVIVVAFVLVRVLGGSSKPSASAGGRTPLPASVARSVTAVPPAALNKIGFGTVIKSPLTAGTGATLTAGGKPEMLYIGAEYCPYCAAMRWPMAVALSRFGTFTSPLRGIHSAGPPETFPNTATLTFYKTTYRSKYLTFTPVENLTVDHKPLQSPSAEQNRLWALYEPDPNQRGYPFIDFGNKFVLKGPIYDPQVLQGLSWAQIAADLHNPSSPVAKGAGGAANVLTAAICKMTNNQPASVCSSPGVKAAAGRL
jgi:hypothetical protein